MQQSYLDLPSKRLSVQYNDLGSDACTVFVHGFLSEKTFFGKYTQLGYALEQKGMSSFSFDFSGCSESSDGVLSLESQVSDLEAVISYLQQSYSQITIVAHSLGGLIASIVCSKSDSVSKLVLLAPVLAPFDAYQHFTQEQEQTLKEQGTLTLTLHKGPRKELVVSNSLPQFLMTFDPASLLPLITAQTLIIHSKTDEKRSFEESKAALPLFQNATLFPVKNDTHNFDVHWNDSVIPKIVDFLN